MKIKRLLAIGLSAALLSSVVLSGCARAEQNNGSSAISESSVVSVQEPETKESKTASEQSKNESSAPQESQVSEISVQESSEQSEQSEQNQNLISPTVWEVTDSDGHTLYMMGSIHAADDATDNMPDYFNAAFAACDSLAVECDVSNKTAVLQSTLKYVKSLMYSDGTKISNHISKEAYDNCVKILTDAGLYSPLYDMYKPFMLASLVENAALKSIGLETENGVDVKLMEIARNDGKQVLEIESLDFQLKMMADMPDDIQGMIIEAYAADGGYEQLKQNLTDLYDHWKNGTLTDEFISKEDLPTEGEEITDEEKELVERYNKIMLYDRNKGMAEKIMQYLGNDQKVMVVVGAAHFYGEKGIISLLKNNGCSIRTLTSADAAAIGAGNTTSAPSRTEQSVTSVDISEVSIPSLDPSIPRAA